MTRLLRGRGLFGGQLAVVGLRLEPGPLRLCGIPLAEYVHVPSLRTTVLAAKRAKPVRKIGTVEHLLAAFGGLGVYAGVDIELVGDELPLLDGAASRWCTALVELGALRSAPPLRIARPAEIHVGTSIYSFTPGPGRKVAVTLDYPQPHLELRAAWEGDPDDFMRRIAPARTFVLAQEIEALADRGMMAHVDPESVVIVDEHALHAAGVSAAADEPARHKLLDLVGDLVLHGGPPEGSVDAFRPGHAATHEAMARARAMGIFAPVPLVPLVLLVLAMCLVSAGTAFADGRSRLDRLPSAPRPPTLPELAHADREATIELTSGAYYPRDTGALRGHVPIHVLRLATELPIHERAFFVGGTYEAAVGSPAGPRAPFMLGGNTEIHGRAVWSTTTGLAFGAGLGIMLPTAGFDQNSVDAFSLASAAIALRPWDHAFFQTGTFAFRPFVDVHDTVGPFIIQFREGLDWTFDVRGHAGQRAFSIATLYVAIRPVSWVAFGMEAHQLYIIDAPVADERRAFFAVSPAVRFMLKHVQPSISLIRSVGAPFYPGTDSTTSMRAGLTLLW